MQMRLIAKHRLDSDDLFLDAVNDLIAKEFFDTNGSNLILTQKGYIFLGGNNQVKEIQNTIFAIFKEFNNFCTAGSSLDIKTLRHNLLDYFNNIDGGQFGSIIDNLIDIGYFTFNKDQSCIVITEMGLKHLKSF